MFRDVRPLGVDLIPGVPLYSYAFEFDPDGPRHIGPLPADLQKVMPSAVYERDGYLAIDTVEYAKLVKLARFKVGALAPN